MSLTSSDQWALARIEIGLRRSDPKLAGMLAVFTYISRRERGPAAEQLSPWRPRLSLVVGATLIAVGIFLAMAFELVLGRARRAEPAIPGTESWRRSPSRMDHRSGGQRR